MLRSLCTTACRLSTLARQCKVATPNAYGRLTLNKYSLNFSGVRTYCKDTKADPKDTDSVQSTVDDIKSKKYIDASELHKVADIDLTQFPDIDLSKFQFSTGEPRKYIEFNCGHCDFRVKKTCTTHSYEKGLLRICGGKRC